MKALLVEHMGELRERSQERGEPRSGPPGPQEDVQRPSWRRSYKVRFALRIRRQAIEAWLEKNEY